MDRRPGASPWLRLRSDEQLVGLFRSGSEEAFSAIHDRYRGRLSVYARQMLGGSGNDADDVLQDVFLRAYRALRADARPVSLRAWLYRVAHNRCIDHLRRPVPPAEEIFEVSRTPIADTTLVAERREDLARLVRDVQRLPDQQRSALLMREMDGMSYADLASALDTSVPAVKSLLVRARIGLVEAIEARDADCSDIRHDLAASYDRGVRASGHARRHMRDCSGCTTFRAQLREVRQGFAALSPGPVAPALLAKVLGLGGAGGAAGGTAAVGGTTAAVGVGKVAAVVCCAAAITGSTVEVPSIVPPVREAPAAVAPAPAGAPAQAQSAFAAALARESAPGAGLHVAPAPDRIRAAAALPAAAEDLALHPDIPMSMAPIAEPRNPHGPGGAAAPAEDTPGTAAPTAQPMDDGDEGLAGVAVGVLTPADEEPAAASGSQEKPASGSSSSASSGSGASSGSQTSTGSGSGTASGSSSSGSSTASSSGSAQSSSTASSSSTAPSGTSSG